MSINSWIGNASPIAQVQTFNFSGTWVIGQTITIAYGTKTWTYTIDSATIATFLPLLKTAYAALAFNLYPEYYEQTLTTTSSSLIFTSKAAGQSFALTMTTNSIAGTIDGSTSSTGVVTTANSGPNDASIPANWSLGYIPQSELTTPVQAATSAVAGGSLTNGMTYYYVITAINRNGETVQSNEHSYTAAGSNLTAHLSWAAVTGATGYKIYRSTTTATYGATSLVTTITSGSTLTYNDTGTSLVSGQPPGSNTALGDSINLSNSTISIKFGFDTFNGYKFANYTQDMSMTGDVGLAKYNASLGYLEYRTRFWPVALTSAGTGVIGSGVGIGSSITRLNLGSGSGKWLVLDTQALLASQTEPNLVFKGNTTSITIVKGSVGLGDSPTDTGTIATVATQAAKDTDVDLTINGAITWTTLNQNGGTVTSYKGGTTWLQDGGVATLKGVGCNLTNLTTYCGAVFNWEATGTITNLLVGEGSTLDASADIQSKTATNLTVYGTLKDPNRVIIATNDIQFPNGIGGQCGASVEWGNNFALTSPVVGSGSGGGSTTPLTTLGDTLYEDATPAAVRLPGNITTTQKVLAQTGTGSISAAPSWVVPPAVGSDGELMLNSSGSLAGDPFLSWNTSTKCLTIESGSGPLVLTDGIDVSLYTNYLVRLYQGANTIDYWPDKLIAGQAYQLQVLGGTVIEIDNVSSTRKLAFFGATPVIQQTANISLTDSTGGSASAALAAVSGTLDDADINNNFASINAQLEILRTLLINYGLGA